jgi:HK97 family phage prohead protease
MRPVTTALPPVFRRAAALRVRAAGADDGDVLDLLASTDEPCSMGGWTERLSHAPGAIDFTACRALCINHDHDQLVGTVRDFTVADGALTCRAALLPGALLESGVPVAEAVKAGALRGVSIGYTYDRDDIVVDEDTRTATVNKWRVLEVSLVTAPADMACGVRSFPSSTPRPPADPALESTVTDIAPAPAALESARAVERAEAKQIALLARSHDLAPEDYVGQPLAGAIDQMLAAKAARAASAPRAPVAHVEVIADAADKANDCAVDSILALHGIPVDGSAGERGYSILEIARRHAVRTHVAGAQDYGRADLASYVLGKRVPGATRSANVMNDFFSTYVLANVLDKAVMNGFASFAQQTTWRKWTSRKTVSSFKQFTVGALDMGNLEATLEGVALPELVKSDAGYNGTLGLYGATVSLSYQALINDDLGEFIRLVQRAGAIAERTIEKLAFTAVSGGTWTSNTTASTALSTATNLDLVREGFEAKTGPGGEKMGNVPKYLLVPSALRGYALTATKQLANAAVQISNADIEAIVTPYLPTVTTKANSKYYLSGDPALVDTVTVAELQGAESPQVMEYDTGATVARGWKIIKPVVAVLASTTIGGTIYIPGMQQGGA